MRVLAIAVVFLTSAVMGGCTDSRADACAGSMPQPACDTAPDLAGAASVPQMLVIGPAPQLETQALLEGRYVLTAQTEYCSKSFTPTALSTPYQAVIEISGCVMRFNVEYDFSSLPEGTMPPVSRGFQYVLTFSYASEGLLNLNLVCPPELAQPINPTKPYGFDGTTFQLIDPSLDESDGEGGSQTCEEIDSYERG